MAGGLSGSCVDRWKEDRRQEIKDIRSLISASQVCCLWRDIALQSATLWANVWLENPRWRQEMMSRARDVPLELYTQKLVNAFIHNLT